MREQLASSMRKAPVMTDKERIGLRQIRALEPGETIWDAALPAFGARRQRSNTVSYVLFYRTKEGRQRWFTIGRHGAPCRRQTDGTQGAHRFRTVRHYWADAKAGRVMTRRRKPKKASTLASDHGRIERHIKPLLGLEGFRGHPG
jgi:hypothetical protein